MKKLFKISLSRINISTVILWGLISCSLYAQNTDIFNGFYVSRQGDSLSGQIKITSIRENLLGYRPTQQDKWTKLTPPQIERVEGERGLYIKSQHTLSNQIADTIFAKKIVGGNCNLYEGYSPRFGMVFFADTKEKPGLVKLNKLGFMAQMKVLFGECTQSTSIKNVKYNSISLENFVNDLNNCIHPSTVRTSVSPRFRPKFGIGVSLLYYSIKPKISGSYFFHGNYHQILRPSIGIFGTIKVNPSISFYTGINYLDKSISTDTMSSLLFTKFGATPRQRYYFRYAMDLNYKYLEIPLGISLNPFHYAKWSPIFNFGFTILHPIVTKVENDWGFNFCPPGQSCEVPPGTVYFAPERTKINRNYLIDFFGGIGLRRRINQHHEFNLRVEYFNQRELADVDLNQPDFDVAKIDIKTHRLQLSLNYYYFLNINSSRSKL